MADAVMQVLSTANSLVVEVGEGLDRIAGATGAQRNASESVTARIGEIAGMARSNNDALAHTVRSARELGELRRALAAADAPPPPPPDAAATPERGA